MATAEQIKALLKSHAEGDDVRFYSTALQVAAKEARRGHHKLAQDIKDLANKGQGSTKQREIFDKTSPFRHQPKGDLKGLLQLTNSNVRRNELILSDEIEARLEEVLVEQKQKDRLKQFDLSPRRKLLFTGAPGTGKTMSASVLANELKLPLYTIVLDSLITRFMGETASKLRLIFDHIAQTRAVYLFDEFDAIGAQRGAQNDVGEIRRILNSFLILVEQDSSESVILAATNHPELLDKALYRRFDDVIQFERPEKKQIIELVETKLSSFDIKLFDWNTIATKSEGLSSAEITRACDAAAKECVLHRDAIISTEILIKAIERRQQMKR